MPSKHEDYLHDYHRRKTGATFRCFGRGSVASGGLRYRSSYHCLAAQIPSTPSRTRILDLACGDGRLLSILAEDPGAHRGLYGVDMSDAELAAACGHIGQRAHLIRARAQSLPLPDASMDWVTSHLALMLMDDIDTVLAEIARVLRPGGGLCAIVPGARTDIQKRTGPLILAALEQAGVRDLVPWGDPRMRSPDGLSDLLGRRFTGVMVRDFDFACPMDPAGYWDFVSDMYGVDCLAPTAQSELRDRIVAAVEPACDPDGMIDSVLGLRLVSAHTPPIRLAGRGLAGTRPARRIGATALKFRLPGAAPPSHSRSVDAAAAPLPPPS